MNTKTAVVIIILAMVGLVAYGLYLDATKESKALEQEVSARIKPTGDVTVEPVKPAKPIGGTIVSNGAIMIAKGEGYLPGLIVKLDTGQVVPVLLEGHDQKSLVTYRLTQQERVLCKEEPKIINMYWAWKLVAKPNSE